MHLIPRELDKILISQVGLIAQRRLARGVKLNHAEATLARGLLGCIPQIALELIGLRQLMRDGNHSVGQLMSIGKKMLGRRHVLPSVTATLTQLQVEGTFPTGTHLVTVDQPISSEDGDMENALYGSFLPHPAKDLFSLPAESEYEETSMPGAMSVAKVGKIVPNEGRRRVALKVTNKGDRPIQVGSHYHFIETNPQLDFDRIEAYGYHLDVPAGTSVRFEPGDTKTVKLVHIGGHKVIRGGSSIAPGPIDISRAEEILRRLQQNGFSHTPAPSKPHEPIEPFAIDRQTYASMFGPTVGDLVRLGATDLWVKVEKDHIGYGDECTFGGGKTLRDGMGQASGRPDAQCLDLVVTNALVVDWSGVFKADIGIKDGFIVGIGKAGNPDIMDGVDPAMVVGSNTDVFAGEGKIVTAGGIDTHVHFICPQQADEAITAGITTLVGGGTGPSTATVAANCTPSKTYIRQMMQACDKLPVNCGIIGKGSDAHHRGLHEQCHAGVVALKLHEDWGCTPSDIDTCLEVCDEFDVQCELHSDTLNESGFVEHTAAAFKDRTIHAYHIEGAGGGHAPDIIRLVEHPNVLPSSTNPTMPYTSNTVDEHLDMVMACHHLSKSIPEDIAFAESRIRAETIAAEDVLHDLGAISMMSSDSQAMGRCGEVIVRTWNTAHKNKIQRGPLKQDVDTDADNHRVKMYISKYTINPAITHGMSHVIGSVEVGKFADLVIWQPANFGTKPTMVLKGGFPASAQMGDPNASISTVQPIISRPMFAPLVPRSSLAFVSKAGVDSGAVESYHLQKRIEIVKGCRKISKRDMKFNSALPEMKVDPELWTVSADGVECKADPMNSLPLTHQYFIY